MEAEFELEKKNFNLNLAKIIIRQYAAIKNRYFR